MDYDGKGHFNEGWGFFWKSILFYEKKRGKMVLFNDKELFSLWNTKYASGSPKYLFIVVHG